MNHAGYFYFAEEVPAENAEEIRGGNRVGNFNMMAHG
jgi:hypothetical protein